MTTLIQKKSKLPATPIKKKSESSLAVLDPLKRYMLEVGRYPLLSLEEEQALVARYQQDGDVNAAKQLVTANLRLVVKIVMDFKKAYSNVLDLIQEGNLGLMRAVQKYDPTKGTRFSHYAAWWIRAYIMKHIIENFRMVKLGTTDAQKKLFFHLMKEQNKLESMGIKPTARAIAERLDVSQSEVEEMSQRLSQSDLSIDTPVNTTSGAGLLEFLTDDTALSSESKLAEKELKETLLEHLDAFTATLKNPRELEIFKERLLEEVPTTLQEIAERYGITRERVRQIEQSILTRLKTYFRKHHFNTGETDKNTKKEGYL